MQARRLPSRAVPDRPPASEARPKARRAGARPYRSGRRGRQRSRGQIALLAGGLTVVLVAVAAATVLVTTPAPAPGHAVQVRTLARVQAVSSVAQGFGARWYTDDSAGTLTRLDPADGRAAGSVSVAGRPTAVITAFGSLWVASTVTNRKAAGMNTACGASAS